ncbi:hypothetical protein CASFOL_012422 [Castilleja foliolosa]|uniref:Disease resistance protein RGA3 n=1 Tax=Castilleja foliolosa TaxID=1961234 RepID=A0ABD3DHS2_9LAMI
MAEIVVGPIIQVLLDNLLTLSQEQIGLVRHFNDDLKKLQKTFSMVNDFLHDAEKRQVTDSVVKRWLRELEDLAFDADNVIDDINYRLLSKKVGANKSERVKRKVKSIFSGYRLKLGKDIKEINDKFETINQTASKLGLQNIAAQAPVYVASEGRQTDSFSEDPIFLGREEDVSSIVDTLITAEQKLSILPIVGMGGQGKTTLARKVFNHEQIKSHFGDNRVWVHVPRIFDDVVLLKRILTSIKSESNVEHGNREALLKVLQKELGAKKYLLLLDDIWSEDSEKWGDFERSLLGISSANGNCMIVTTRSERAASIVGALRVYKLKGLSRDDCWSIIKAKAFREGDNPLDFEATGKHVASNSKDEWMSIEKDWLAVIGDENPITKILRLSFDNLPLPSVKKCFAYCSIFPRGYRIEKEQLIELWMAEGFIHSFDGNIIFNLLLQNSLLQVTGRDNYGNVTDCNMHDLVHDLAFSVLCENDNVTDGVCQSRYIGYKPSGDGLISIPKGQERYVRTLFFDGKVSDIRFSDFESLRTLIFVGGGYITELPTSITNLKHLRYLDISKTRIQYLPDSIGDLYHLQTLRAKKYYLYKLPGSLSCLISLRHLHLFSTTALPQGIGKLTSLQTLSCFCVGGEQGPGISELGNLKDLNGKLEIHNLQKVCDKNEAMSADLLRKTGIYDLKLVWEGTDEGDDGDNESVLEGLIPHPNLKRLEICGFKGKNLSLWEGLNNLVDIMLRNCSECEELPMLGHLPHLKSLYLSGLTNVKSIRSSFYGNIDNYGNVVFLKLERLELWDMPNLKEWDDVVVFPRLKYLKIYKCVQLTRAPSHFPCLEDLEIEDMESSLALESICGINLTSLTHLTIRQIVGLECLPDWLFSNNHNLRELDIKDCPKMTHLVPHLGGESGAPSLLRVLKICKCPSLRELPDDLRSLNALEKLVIDRCPDLKSISSGGGGQQQQGFTSLRRLEISKCKELISLPIEMVCAPSLETLELRRLSSITNLDVLIMCLHRMTRLRYLGIDRVPKFSIKHIMNVYLSLQHLELGPSSSDSSTVSYDETLGAMLLQCISLRRLTLTGMKDWDCLPDQLQHLTSLEELELRRFGIEALPEWIGNLESLKELTLEYCKKLRHLPSKQAMLRLSKLTFLDIFECPLLFKENNNIDNRFTQIVDSEWPKISHISTILANELPDRS